MNRGYPSTIPGYGKKQRPSLEEMQTTTLRTSDGTLLPNGFPDNPTVIRDVRDQVMYMPNVITRTACLYRSEQAYRFRVGSHLSRIIAMANNSVRRPLSQDEVDAIVQHNSIRAYHDRIGISTGLGLAVLHTWSEVLIQGIFPTPRQMWEVMRHSGQRPVPAFRDWFTVRGVTRSMLWQELWKPVLVRGFLYPILGYSLFTTFGSLNSSVDMQKDERLRDFSESLKNWKPELTREARSSLNQAYREMEEGKERGVSQDQSQSSQIWNGSGQTQTQEPVFAESDQLPYSDSPTQTFKQPEVNNYPLRPTPSPAPSTDNTGDFFDDASPVASDYQSQPALQTQGSAWERIRQQNMSGGDQPQRTRETYYSGDRSRPSDDYGYAKEKEREQAKAEFDKLLESERNMSTDNGGGSGWNRRW